MRKSLSLNTILFILFLTLTSCATEKGLFVSYSNPNIAYSGRIDTLSNKSADFYWSSTTIRMNFEGESIGAIIKDERGDNYYNIIIDNDSLYVLRPDTIKKNYTLASNLSKGNHTIEIFKRTEWDRGKTTFYGFEITGNAHILPRPPLKGRKIEFYGNSITAGYAVEDFSGRDRPDSVFTNSYRSYATLTAKHFDAEYNIICKSGIGIVVSWFPLTMPEMYNRLIPDDSESRWDFSLFTPDIVVINLFQNDSWLVNMPNHEQFISKFGTEVPTEEYIIQTYEKLIQNIRKEYPDADIICALGNMDATRENSKWPIFIKTAVNQISDSKIHTHIMPYKNSPGHPTISEQETMANSLIEFINDNIKW